MNCPDCNDPRLEIDWEKNHMSCPNCKFESEAVTFLNGIRDGRGRNWNFSIDKHGWYQISVGGHQVGQMRYVKKAPAHYSFYVSESDVAWRLVKFVRSVIGETVLIDITLQSYDTDLTCPICQADAFVRDDIEVSCKTCGHFKLDVYTYLISRLMAEGYQVSSRSLGEFSIGTRGFWGTPVAELQDRDEVFALRPIGSSTQVEKLKLFIESLGLCERVVVLKQKYS